MFTEYLKVMNTVFLEVLFFNACAIWDVICVVMKQVNVA